MPRTSIPIVGGAERVAEHNLYDLRSALPNTGNIFFVDSSAASGGNGQSPEGAVTTLDAAQALCTANNGDVIYVLEGHAETTTAIALDVAGVTIIGLGVGRARPALTATTAATDLVNVSAANVRLENIRLIGAASGCTALLDIAAGDFIGRKLSFEHGAAPLSAVTVTVDGDRFVLEDCNWLGTAAGPDHCILIEGKADGWKVIRARGNYAASSGLDLAFIHSSFKMKDYIIENPIICGIDTLAIDFNSSSAAVGDGVCTDGTFVASAALTSVEDLLDVGGCVFRETYGADAVTGSAARIPITTVS